MRISVRLADSHSKKLQLLARAAQVQTTEIVKRAIDSYFDQMVVAGPSAARILRDQGFVASGAAEPNLSERYKELLKEGWAAKHGDR